MKNNKYAYLFIVLMALFTIISCSENDGEINEFTDWQHKNEVYFNQLYAKTKEHIAKGDDSWKIIRKWSLPKDDELFHANLSDYVIVHIIENSKSNSGSPLYTDSVSVHYRGRLIPSPTYTAGFIFDSSYKGKYNLPTMVPTKFAVNGLVDGFATALMHMKVGDRWEVYIPYQLGYGNKEQANGKVPAYSTLIFDITLDGFYRPKGVKSMASVSASK